MFATQRIVGGPWKFLRAAAAFSSQVTSSSLNLSGVFPAIATPFDQSEELALDKLEENVTRWRQVPFRGYVALGSTGECVSLTSDEKVALVTRLSQLIMRSGDVRLLLAGVGCESTRDTIALISKMAAAGADGALVVTPSYYKGRLTSHALEQHFSKIADASVLPVVLYSVPANTGVDLDPDVVVKLAHHPNVIGLKDSGGDVAKLAYIVHKTRDLGFQVLAGSAGFLMAALQLGCVGGVLASGNVLGHEACELLRLVESGRMAEARSLQHRLIGPNWAVTKKFGIPGVKCALDLFGLYGGPLRSPLSPLTNQEEAVLKTTFQESGFQFQK